MSAFDVLPTSDGKKVKVSVTGEKPSPTPPTDSKAYNSLFSANPEVIEGLVNIEPTNGIFGRESNATYSSKMSDSMKKEVAIQLDGYFSTNKKYTSTEDSFKLESTQEQLSKNSIQRECKDLKPNEKVPVRTLIDCWKAIEVKPATGAESSAAKEKTEKKPAVKHHSAVQSTKTPAAAVSTETNAAAEEKAKTDSTATETAKASEKAAEASKAEKTAQQAPAAPAQPVKAPEQRYYQHDYQPQWRQQPPAPSVSPMLGSALFGGAIGGFIGALFGGFRGFMGGLFGGLLGGLMNFGGFGGGFVCGGMDPMDAALNMTFARFLNSVSLPPMVTPQPQSRPASAPSNLPELNDSNFDSAIKNSKTPVVVDFYADWCEPCKEQSPIVDGIAKDYSGKAQVYKVNVDKAEKKTDEYKVEKIPTILVFQDGKVVERFEGLKSREELTKALDKYAPKTAPAATAQTPAPAATTVTPAKDTPANQVTQKDSTAGTAAAVVQSTTEKPNVADSAPSLPNEAIFSPEEIKLSDEIKTLLAGHSPNKYTRLKEIDRKLFDGEVRVPADTWDALNKYISKQDAHAF